MADLDRESRERIPGFTWRSLPEIRAAIPMPDLWFFDHASFESSGGGHQYLLTRETIWQGALFKTGLTIVAKNEIAVMYSSGDLTVMQGRSMQIMDSSLSEDDTWATARTESTGIPNFLLIRRGTNSVKRYVHIFMRNKRTDTTYLIIFETPETKWENDKQIAERMLANLKLDRDY